MPDDTPLTPAECATRAAAVLDAVTHAVSGEYASAFVGAAHAWMALGQLIEDRPAWRPGTTEVRNRYELLITAEAEVTKAADIAEPTTVQEVHDSRSLGG